MAHQAFQLVEIFDLFVKTGEEVLKYFWHPVPGRPHVELEALPTTRSTLVAEEYMPQGSADLSLKDAGPATDLVMTINHCHFVAPLR